MPQHDDEFLLIHSNRLMWFMPIGGGPGFWITIREAMLRAADDGLSLRTQAPDMAGAYPLDQAKRLAEKFRTPIGPGLGIPHTRYWMVA